jgi:hypothetical protein
MQALLADMVTLHLARPPSSGRLVATIVGAMFVQAISWWLKNDQPSSPREIATQTAQLASAIINQANSWVPAD